MGLKEYKGTISPQLISQKGSHVSHVRNCAVSKTLSKLLSLALMRA